MRRVFLAVAIAAAAILAAAPSSAQVRAQNYKVQRVHKVPPVLFLPRAIKPSAAVGRALARFPGAKPLGVRMNKQGFYIIKVKQGNVISKVRVDAITGDVLP